MEDSVQMSVQLEKLGIWPGGTVVDLAVDGEIVLAATFAGIYRSTDGGCSWQPVDADLPDWFIQTVVLAPMQDQVMALAASHMGWLYRSVDAGQTWETVSEWRDLGVVTRLVPSPNFAADGIVFACTEEDGVFKSTDRGRTWKSASFGLLNLNATALVYSDTFARDEVAFVGTDGGGFFRSRNAGRAWRESGEGLPNSAVQCLAISPIFAQDRALFAGTEDVGLYRSLDGGRTWSPAGEALAETCINGLYLPPDWADGGRVLAATDEGILASADGGATWQETEGGPYYPYVIVRAGDGLLAGAYDEGVYRSVDGITWQACNDNLAAHLPPTVCFSEAFERDRTLWMASMEGVAVRSTDAGQDWTALPNEIPISMLTGAGDGAAMTLLAAVEATLLRSGDGGDSWEAVVSAGEDPISVLATSRTYAQDATMLAGTAGGQVLVSNDGGASWRQSAHFVDKMLVAVASRAQADGRTMNCAVVASQTPRGAWQLTLRAGEQWTEVLSREADELVAVLYPSADGQLFCALGRRVLCLQDGQVVGESELEGTAPVSCLAQMRDAVLAGTRAGLYRSTDDAQSWELVSGDIPVVALHAAPSGQVYAVSMGGRLWKVDLPG
jgi:photosystem II stability/assembly factor-like uncharacterized protein